MNIMLLGAPGVGKTTYGVLVAEELHVPHISTGDMFREHMKGNTDLGKLAKSYIDKGQLVSDDVTTDMLKDRLGQKDCRKGYILNGYPRNLNQAKLLDDITSIDVVLNFVADEKIILQRLSGRRVCRKCGATYHIVNMPTKLEGICDLCKGEVYQRSDDTESAVKNRLNEYGRLTAPLIKYYKSIIHDVDVSSSYAEREKVIANIMKILKI
jgi:adenylate kinase